MFSGTKAAFEGFRLAGRHPFLMLFWTIAYTVAIIAVCGAAMLMILPLEFWRALLAGHGDFPAYPDFSPLRFAIVFPLAFIAIVLLTVMSTTATYRAVLRPRERGFGYLAIGGDEGRQILLNLLIVLLTVPVVAAVIVLGGIGLARIPEAFRMLAGVLAAIGGAAFLVWISTRLSLAAVQTFAERRVTLFGSWKLTRGRFWPLVGMWLLALAFSVLVSFVAGMLSYLPLLFAGTGVTVTDFGFWPKTGPDSITAAVVVAFGLQALIQMIGSVVQIVVGVAPAAAAYAQLKDQAA